MQAIKDKVVLAWEIDSRVNTLGGSNQSPLDLAGTNRDTGMADRVISAMTKLSASMVAHQAATLKKQEEKDDSTLKVWRRLPKLQQQVILLGGVEEDGTVLKDTTEEMADILGYQNGAQVE